MLISRLVQNFSGVYNQTTQFKASRDKAPNFLVRWFWSICLWGARLRCGTLRGRIKHASQHGKLNQEEVSKVTGVFNNIIGEISGRIDAKQHLNRNTAATAALEREKREYQAALDALPQQSANAVPQPSTTVYPTRRSSKSTATAYPIQQNSSTGTTSVPPHTAYPVSHPQLFTTTAESVSSDLGTRTLPPAPYPVMVSQPLPQLVPTSSSVPQPSSTRTLAYASWNQLSIVNMQGQLFPTESLRDHYNNPAVCPGSTALCVTYGTEVFNIYGLGVKAGPGGTQQLIGSGRFGRVFKAYRVRNGQVDLSSCYALKLVKQDFQASHPMAQEGECALTVAGCSNVLGVNKGFILQSPDGDPSKNMMFLEMEWCEARSLEEEMKDPATDLSKKHTLLQQFANGIAWCHFKGIAHRDLHMENAIVPYTQTGHPDVKVIDFGCAEKKDAAAQKMVGRMDLYGPEVANPNSGVRITEKADVFAWGIEAYKACSYSFCSHPVNLDNALGPNSLTLRMHRNGLTVSEIALLQPDNGNGICDSLKWAIHFSLQSDPNNRPHMANIYKLLNHKETLTFQAASAIAYPQSPAAQ